jgi:hypothetical protein
VGKEGRGAKWLVKSNVHTIIIGQVRNDDIYTPFNSIPFLWAEDELKRK